MNDKKLIEEANIASDIGNNIWIVDDETGEEYNLHSFYKSIEEELMRRLALVPKWRPIAEAPKDGTPILGFANGTMTVVEWFVKGEYWYLVEPGSYAEDGEWWPTHFMLLPEPPKEQE